MLPPAEVTRQLGTADQIGVEDALGERLLKVGRPGPHRQSHRRVGATPVDVEPLRRTCNASPFHSFCMVRGMCGERPHPPRRAVREPPLFAVRAGADPNIARCALDRLQRVLELDADADGVHISSATLAG